MQSNGLNKVTVLIPSLDPDEQLVHYVEGLIQGGITEIIIVDDGSSEESQRYFDIVRNMAGVTVLHHAINQGKGRALKTGFHYFLNTYRKSEMAGIITADADGQHCVEDTVKVAECLKNNAESLVLGTRNFKEENVPFKSRYGNQITTAVFSILYGKKIHDTQTGLRGIPYSFVSSCLKMEGERFDFEIVMLIQAVRQKRNLIEVPIQTIYINSNRATHFRAVVDSAKIYGIIFKLFFKFALSGILSFAIDIGLFTLFTKIIFSNLETALSVFWGTLLARICSSFFNFNVNRTLVFDNKQSFKMTVIKYYFLCAVQILCSWLLVVFFYERIHMDTTLIKLIVDIMLFFISFQIQRVWVYKEK